MDSRRKFARGWIALCLYSITSAAVISGRANDAMIPDDQIIPVREQCFDFKLNGSRLEAFCIFRGAVPVTAGIDLNSCIENSSGEMLFNKDKGGTDALRTCTNCSLTDLSLQCDCLTLTGSSGRSAIELDGEHRDDHAGIFALVSGELVCR